MADDMNVLADRLKGILDGGGAEKLSELLGGAKTPEKQPQTSGFDIDSIMKIKNAYDKINSKPDPRVSLLSSLRPYMSPGRASQLDGIVRLLSLTKISDLFREMKGGL